MNSKNKVPQIRFKGFSEEWEESDLGDKVEFFSGLTYSPNNVVKNNGTLVLRSSNVKDGRIVDADNVYVNSDVVNCSNVQKGDIAVVVRNGSRSLIGKHAQIQKEMKNTVIGAFMTGIRSEQPSFTNALLDSSKFSKEIEKNLGATINQITTGAFKKMIFFFPEQNEQTKIGDYFQQLDKLIEQKEKKYEKLKQFKKAMLSKMFPKNGADTPEIRFKGFSGKWEEKRFKDNIVSIQTGTNLLGATTNKGIPLIKMGNIQRGYFSFEKVEYLNENSEIETENIANYGDFLFNTRNTLELVGKGATWMGDSGRFAFNSNLARFTFNGINTIFFNYLYNTQSMISQVQARAMGTTSVAAIYPKNLNSIEYYLPDLEEQTKIGNYFQKLDKLIELQLQEIEKLKNIKKASLAKMFV